MAVDGMKEAWNSDYKFGKNIDQVVFDEDEPNVLFSPEVLIQERTALNQKLSDIRVKYWDAKNRCSCYTMTYGEYDDKQMVHWAREAYNLGRKYDKMKKRLFELEQIIREVFGDKPPQVSITFTIKEEG